MMLSAHDLTLKRGGRTVLSGVNATLRAGEVTAILGPNGAGKSTLLAALAGLGEAVAGQVLLAPQDQGRSFDKLRTDREGEVALGSLSPAERARRIGYLPQSGEVAWNLSVRALAGLGRLPWRGASTLAQDRVAVDTALKTLDLEAFADRPVASLSGGERARALLARVLATEPEWILADEPLAALDLAHQLALARHFRALAGEGRGVVLVLHDLALAMNHADRVLVLGAGCVLADGPPGALAPAVIAQAWGVDADWVGAPGERALVLRR